MNGAHKCECIHHQMDNFEAVLWDTYKLKPHNFAHLVSFA